MVGRSTSVGDHLRHARSRAFVGRDAELMLLQSALARSDGVPAVFSVQGPGGIGKSSLLREFVDRAREVGRSPVWVDGRMVGPSSRTFELAAGPIDDSATVLVVDTFEQCRPIETWLREEFLPRLPSGAVVVIAGREPLDVEWSVDPGWAQSLHIVALAPLPDDDAGKLLGIQGVDVARHLSVIGFAGGNPLALRMAAAVVTSQPGVEANWTPSGRTLATLLDRLVGKAPSTAHRRALDAAAQAFTMTEDLLRAALPEGDRSDDLFDWLRDLPFMNLTTDGIHPRDAVRETLVADLRWRDREAFHAMQTRLKRPLLARVRAAPPSAIRPAVAELFFLYRTAQAEMGLWKVDGQDLVQDEPLQPQDAPTVVAFTHECEGPASAELVRHWLDRRPDAFTLYRHLATGRPVAFTARIRLPAVPDPGEVSADPVVAAAWDHAAATSPVRDGEHIVVNRFTVDPGCYQRPSAVTHLIHQLALADVARSRDLAYTFLAYQQAEDWQSRFGSWVPDTGRRAKVGDRTFALFANDWRQLPFDEWLDLLGGSRRRPDLSTAETTRGSVGSGGVPDELSRAQFGEAVRSALQLWHRPGTLSHSPLLNTRLVTPGVLDPEQALRERIAHVIHAGESVPRAVRGRAAVVTTYLDGAPTQQAAAHRLGVPFSTYRRHLKQGLEGLSDRLWQACLDSPRDG